MVYLNGHFSSAFCLPLTFRLLCLGVWWTSTGKVLSSRFSADAVLYLIPS